MQKDTRADFEKDKNLRRKLRGPLKIAQIVLALVECLKMKDVPGNLYKNTIKTVSFIQP